MTDQPDHAAFTVAAPPARPSTFLPEDDHPIVSRRGDGWSAANQRLFLEALAEGHGVEVACGRVGLSASSAYAFRRSAKGAAFALGWRAASLVARDAIAETLLVRALDGTVETIIRGETVITRHKYDNRLALALLARLDRQVEAAPDADIKAARLVAQEFDAYLGLIEQDPSAARAGLFLARRGTGRDGGAAVPADAHDLAPIYALAAADRLVRTGVATAGEIDIADLDIAARAGWTAEQWQRAEAAGLLALAAPAADDDEPVPASQHSQHSRADGPPIWWDECAQDWRTHFPPPPDFRGPAPLTPGSPGYERGLTPDEAVLIGWHVERCEEEAEAALAPQAAERDAYFALLAQAMADEEDEDEDDDDEDENGEGDEDQEGDDDGDDRDAPAPPPPDPAATDAAAADHAVPPPRDRPARGPSITAP